MKNAEKKYSDAVVFNDKFLYSLRGKNIQTFHVQQKKNRMIFVSPENNFVG